jgi:hypothetical protein
VTPDYDPVQAIRLLVCEATKAQVVGSERVGGVLGHDDDINEEEPNDSNVEMLIINFKLELLDGSS